MNPITLPARDPTSAPNPTFVRLLNAALPVLWDGVGSRYDKLDLDRGRFYERYICLAIVEGQRGGDLDRDDWSELTRLIDQRLDGSTFDGWAWRRQGVDEMETVRIQAGRIAWIHDLVAEFGG